jgi:hypothetical protein
MTFSLIAGLYKNVPYSELMNFFVAGRDQSAADQPNNLAEGPPNVNLQTSMV